ncbi:MAG: greA [Candidatus Saccharibacteria bacterium]|nr:greA [Candidatus Saccharibacteria bacterium]
MNTTTELATVMLSKKGMKELQKSISQLEHDRHQHIIGLHELDKTTGHDDRLERIERLARLEVIESDLADKKATLLRAKLIPSKRARLRVAMGSVVDLIDQQGRLISYTLVDSIEANPSDGRISVASPLGQSLVGKTAKDIVEWGSGLKANQLQLVRIH